MNTRPRLVLILKCGHFYHYRMGRLGYPQRRRCNACRKDSVTVVHALNLDEELGGQKVLWQGWEDLEELVQEYATAWHEQATIEP